MTKVFKISYINKNDIKKIYVFLGEKEKSEGNDEDIFLLPSALLELWSTAAD